MRTGNDIFVAIVTGKEWDFTDAEFERAVLDRQNSYPVHLVRGLDCSTGEWVDVPQSNMLPINGSDFSGEVRNMLSALANHLRKRDLPEVTAWIATSERGSVMHFSKADGWEVKAVGFTPGVTETSTTGQPTREYVLIPSRWIDTTVRVPCDGDDVIGYWEPESNFGKVHVGSVHYFNKVWRSVGEPAHACGIPDFWMPLPKLPNDPASPQQSRSPEGK